MNCDWVMELEIWLSYPMNNVFESNFISNCKEMMVSSYF